MSDSVWYYAQNDQERGPVSATELRSLAASGKLRGSDLVWKEGMEVWTAAAQIKGLLPEAAAKNSGSDSGTRVRPQGMRDSPREAVSTGAAPREARWLEGPPADDAVQTAAPRVPMTSGGTTRIVQPAAQRAAGNLFGELPKYLRLIGIGLIAVGLMLVFSARGCDTLAERYTARVIALASVEKERFEQEWDRKRRELEAEIAALEAKANRTRNEENLLVSRQTELNGLSEKKLEEQRRLSQDRWADLQAAAATAADDNRAWGFWRGILFVFGTAVLLPGLLLVGFLGQNVERWIALGMLGVVLYSLFIGDSAWSTFLGR